jgi:hypothetical protein
LITNSRKKWNERVREQSVEENIWIRQRGKVRGEQRRLFNVVKGKAVSVLN